MSIPCTPNPVFVDFRFGVGRGGRGENIKTGVWVQEIDENEVCVTLIGVPFENTKLAFGYRKLTKTGFVAI